MLNEKISDTKHHILDDSIYMNYKYIHKDRKYISGCQGPGGGGNEE